MNSQEILKGVEETRLNIKSEAESGTLNPVSIGLYNCELLVNLFLYIESIGKEEK